MEVVAAVELRDDCSRLRRTFLSAGFRKIWEYFARALVRPLCEFSAQVVTNSDLVGLQDLA